MNTDEHKQTIIEKATSSIRNTYGRSRGLYFEESEQKKLERQENEIDLIIEEIKEKEVFFIII